MATLTCRLREPDGTTLLPESLTVRIGTDDGVALDHATHAVLGGPKKIEPGTENVELPDLTAGDMEPAGAVYLLASAKYGVLKGRTWYWDGHMDVFLDDCATSGPGSTPSVVIERYDDTAIFAELEDKADAADLAAVATSGVYSDLAGKPTIPTTPGEVGADPAGAAAAAQAFARQRGNHTGSQTASTISDFLESVQDAVGAMLTSGANVTLSYDDTAGTVVVNASGPDVELMRDTIGAVLVGINGVTIAPNDGADTITFSITGLTIAQTTGLQAALDAKLDANQREINSGIAGLTSAGKLYEARIPDRLSDTALSAAFVSPRAEGRAARWVARITDRTKPLFHDSFDRADAASALGTADSGHAWVNTSGTWKIVNHRAALATGTEGCATVDLGVPADFIEADLVNAPSGVPDPGLLIRCVDSNNYLLIAHETTLKLNIWKKVAGVYTNIAAVTTHSTLYSFGQTPFLRADYQRGTGRVTATVAGANGLRYTVAVTLGSTDRTLFELGTKVGLRSGTSDFGSGYTNVLAGVK